MPKKEPTWFEFIETPIFTRRLTELASPEVLTALQANLIEDPERWPVVQSTGGARKGRIADPRAGVARVAAIAIFTCTCRTPV
jgi:hypothetical protein